MNMNWRQAADTSHLSIEDLKELLPIPWAISVAAGIPLSPSGDGKLAGNCPFHEDTSPSLDVFDGGDRWGCYPCGLSGDVFDWIGNFYKLESFNQRFQKAQALYNQFDNEPEWESPIEEVAIPTVSPQELYSEWYSAWNGDWQSTAYILHDFVVTKGLHDHGVDAQWLHDSWLVATDINSIIAPYLDAEAHIISSKSRSGVQSHWYAKRGAPIRSLYGEWRMEGRNNLVIVEGETDTWLMSKLLEGVADVVGLPTGAGAHVRDEWAALCTNKVVTLIFDADTAGRNAARRWSTSLDGIAKTVLVGWPDEDSDLGESTDPLRAYREAMPPPIASQWVLPSADGAVYLAQSTTGNQTAISNFTFIPTRFMRVEDQPGQTTDRDDIAFEGYLNGSPHRMVTLSRGDLLSANRFNDWATRHGRAYHGGSGKQTSAIFDLLMAESPFIPRGTITSLAGFRGEENVFIMPEASGGCIGSALGQWRYEPPTSGGAELERYQIRKGPWQPETIPLLRGLYSDDIITPMLAWFTAAFFRSVCDVFPTLAVFGTSGTGKTTLTVMLMRVMHGYQGSEISLQSTAHAVRQWASSNSGLGTFFDEYRKGARKDSIITVNQTVRDAWTASTTERGGQGENLSDLQGTTASAPLIIGGESAFSEQSHIERSIQLALNISKQGPTFADLQGTEFRGFAYALLTWMMEGWSRGAITAPDLSMRAVAEYKTTSGIEQSDRDAQGEMVVRWGWSIFKEFALIHGTDVGELDLSTVRSIRIESDDHPIITALQNCLESEVVSFDDKRPIAWIKDGHINVRVHEFTQWADRNKYELPGNETAVRSYMKEQWGANEGRPYWSPPQDAMSSFSNKNHAVQIRALMVPVESAKDDLDLSDEDLQGGS